MVQAALAIDAMSGDFGPRVVIPSAAKYVLDGAAKQTTGLAKHVLPVGLYAVKLINGI
jgi:fatty acid/phospholipid biosynthesis enzyme